MQLMNDISVLVVDVQDHYGCIITGDFNLSVDIADRGDILYDLYQ